MRSRFDGKPINPPDARTRLPWHRSTPEEREFVLELNKIMPGEWRAIARRVFREFGVDRSVESIKNWVKEAGS